MEQRVDFYKASPEVLKGMIALENVVGKLGLETSLLELVRLRVSLINGCAFCVDMHTADARKAGELEIAHPWSQELPPNSQRRLKRAIRKLGRQDWRKVWRRWCNT